MYKVLLNEISPGIISYFLVKGNDVIRDFNIRLRDTPYLVDAIIGDSEHQGRHCIIESIDKRNKATVRFKIRFRRHNSIFVIPNRRRIK